MKWIERARSWARSLKKEVIALWIAARSSLTPMGARLVAGAVAAYALSPVDLIPDFIPVLGYLDDIVIVPLGIALAIRLIPPVLFADFRAQAAARSERPRSYIAAAIFAALWVLAAAVAAAWLRMYFH